MRRLCYLIVTIALIAPVIADGAMVVVSTPDNYTVMSGGKLKTGRSVSINGNIASGDYTKYYDEMYGAN